MKKFIEQIKTTKKLPKELNAQLINKTKGFALTKLYRINEIPITENYTNIYEYLIDIKTIKNFSTQKIKNNDIIINSTLKISNNSIENNAIALTVKNNTIEITDKKNRNNIR